VVAEFPGTRLVTDCPTYTPEARESETVQALRAVDVTTIPERPQEVDPLWALGELLASPTIASKRWVYRQYDTMVRTSTVIGPGGDAAVVRLRGTDRAVAVKTDCNGRHCYLDPREGARGAVAEAARNVACTGARPLAITNNLNFGNPTRPDVYFQLREAVGGLGEACRALGTPVTGGNVSLYNENPTGAVYPTPVVGMVGLIDSLAHVTRATFRPPVDGAAPAAIVLLGTNTDELGGSEYLAHVHGRVAGAPPHVDLDAELRLINALLAVIRAGHVRSAHDTSDGGLAVALAECAMADPDVRTGVEVDLSPWAYLPTRALLYAESHGRVIVSTDAPNGVLALAAEHSVPATVIGRVTTAAEGFVVQVGESRWSASIDALARGYHETIPAAMAGPAAAAA
ncbi:MAG: AIR synthase related protein, partial [Candidatus Eremiobacteraeota bacterium]|nr:AIR synthase related protein [Candidatus Eremiobacteraeota bacterium]